MGLTKTGGHLCYFSGALLPTGQWFPEPVFEFLNYFARYSMDEELTRSSSFSTMSSFGR
jgi:hypothetical protein